MQLPEFNRHRIRAQLLKIIAHLHEARKQIHLCEDHEKIVRNANKIVGIAPLQLDTPGFTERVDALSANITLVITEGVSQADALRDSMDNPNNRTPPITGRFLSLEGLTAEQRSLARDGRLPHSDIPTHHPVIDPLHQTKPPKPNKRALAYKSPPPKPRRKLRNEMPI